VYLILWEYHVKPQERAEFEEIYSPTGAWAELFQKGAGYLGTELLHDETNPRRYVTIDRWESKAAYETFLSVQEQAYKEMDARCEGLTEHESLLGKWTLEQK
jgi:heme-degrading monooxygenase HmoA